MFKNATVKRRGKTMKQSSWVYSTVKETRQTLKSVDNIFLNYNEDCSYKDCEFDDMKQALYRLEKLALSLRNGMIECTCNGAKAWAMKQDYDDYVRNICFADLPVSVNFDGKTLRVKTPITLKRSNAKAKENLRQNYNLQEYVRLALEKWQEENGSIFHKIKSPYVILVKRIGDEYAKDQCDNDNFEGGRIINMITSTVGYSDNASVCDMYFTWKQGSEPGSEFVMFAKSDLPFHLAELCGENE